MAPAKLTRLLRGELDWLVMKCLEKDRSRRYETANALALDVQRYLADEPVLARPPSTWYRLRKFARRNKGAFAGTLVAIAVVLLTIVGLAVNNWMVTRQKDRADRNLSSARQAVEKFLRKTSDNPLLKSADFQNLRTELLESAIPFLEDFVRQSQSDPNLEAERGRVYQDLADLRRELGAQTLALEELAKAEEIFRRLRKTIPDEPAYAHDLADTLITRGALLDEVGRFDPAESALREALDILQPLGPDYRFPVARAMSNLGVLFGELDRPTDSEAMYHRAITLREELLGEHPGDLELLEGLATNWVNMGALFIADQRADEAQKAFEKVLEVLQADSAQKLPAASVQSLTFQQIRAKAFNNLGVIHVQARRFDDGEKAYLQALTIKKSLADTFPSAPEFRHELAQSHNNLGSLMRELKRTTEARDQFEMAISIYDRLGADSSAVPLYAVELAGTYINLGTVMGDLGQREESLPILTKGIDILEKIYSQEPRFAKVRESLVLAHWPRAFTLCGLHRYLEGVEDYNRAIELDDGTFRNELRYKRSSCYLNLEDYAQAYADAEAIADSDNATVTDLYRAARVCAYCSRLAAEETSLREQYALRAVRALRQARDKSYNDLERLKNDLDNIKNDPVLNPLRAREDFQELLREMEAGADKQNEEKPDR
jgi:tetratricopeptide (TPR) repeat protein